MKLTTITSLLVAKKTAITIGAFAALTSVSQAATITWGAVQTITNENDIISPTTVVQATTYGNLGAQTVTVGGTDIVFADGSGNYGTPVSDAIAWGGSAAADTDFETVMDSWNFHGDTAPLTQTISGLTDGQQYQVQFFFTDARGCCNGRTQTFGNTVADGGVASAALTAGTGEFVIGTFTASGTTQDFVIGGGPAQNHVNAFVVASVPEPSSAALLGLGGLALIMRRRK